MKIRRLGLSALVLAVLGLGALAVASDRHLTASPDSVSPDSAAAELQRPEPVVPETVAPSVEFLELQKQAIPQPSGVLTPDSTPRVPGVARPQR